jgi:hypothetical protein
MVIASTEYDLVNMNCLCGRLRIVRFDFRDIRHRTMHREQSGITDSVFANNSAVKGALGNLVRYCDEEKTLFAFDGGSRDTWVFKD